MHWNCEHFHFLPFLPSPFCPLLFLKGLLETLYYVRSTTYSFVLRSIANKPVKRREMLKLYLGAVGKMAWKLLLFYLDKLTLSELQIQGPLWPFIMKKSISTLQVSHNFAAAFGCHHLQFQSYSSFFNLPEVINTLIGEMILDLCTWHQPLQKKLKTCSKILEMSKRFQFKGKGKVVLAGFSYEFKTSCTFIKLKHKR